ncbi:MAG: hypothetical protein II940_01385, partial [Methanosarcinaceae archaeon]|nr:hypothetical protein [Methanosarcinaceae archaeon]
NIITLTDKGRKVATKIYTREKELTLFLENLGVSADTARKDACKMEHIIASETYEKFVRFCSFALTEKGALHLDNFKKYCDSEKPEK